MKPTAFSPDPFSNPNQQNNMNTANVFRRIMCFGTFLASAGGALEKAHFGDWWAILSGIAACLCLYYTFSKD